MRFSPVFALSILGMLYSLPVAGQSTSPSIPPATPQIPCHMYVSLEEANQQRWANLLSTPVVMPDPTILKADSRTREGWDLPKQITPWRPRLEQSDYRKYMAVLAGKANSHWKGLSYQEKTFWRQRSEWLARPKYAFLPITNGEQVKIESYLANHRDRFPGVCADPNRATYFIEIAHLEWVGSYWAANRFPAESKKAQFLSVQQTQPFGPPDMHGGEPMEPYTMHRDGGIIKDSPPVSDARYPDFSCAYIFKAKPFSVDKNSRIPLYSYCPYGGNLQAATVKMLEFLSQHPSP